MGDTVVIVVGSKSYEVSKTKLIEKSSYFKSMFNGEFLEKNKTSVNLKEIDPTAWEDILHYLETGKIRPKPYTPNLHKEILKLLVTSDMLLFHDIRDLCVEALVEIMTPENCLEILQVATRLELPTLVRKSRAVALWNADIITYTKAFYGLDVDLVESYLSDPGVHTDYGEWGVWEAINRWMVSDPTRSRNKYLPRLIKCVSLKYLPEYDLRTISFHEGVRSNAVVSAAVLGILDDGMIAPEVNDFINRWRSMPRRRLPLVPAVVCKINLGPTPSSPYIVRYSQEDKKFIPYLRLDQVESNLNSLVGFRVLSDGSKLYMLGGEIITRQPAWYLAVWEYDQILGYWNFLTNLRKETRHCGVCVFENDLYIIGGFARDRMIRDDVSKFSLIDKKWSDCAPLLRPMYGISCCAFKGRIYAIKTEVHEYDPVLDTWELLDIDLPAGDVICVAMATKDYVFVAGLKKTVYKFDPTGRNWNLVEVGRFTENCTQACLVDDYIYNMTQTSSEDQLICERMHIRSGQRETVWQAVAGDEIDTFSPNHQHGCFPLLMY